LTGLKAIIRLAISSDIQHLMDLDHNYSTDHVWQMGLEKQQDVVLASFREVRLPRPMRVEYPRDPLLLADEWTHKSLLLVVEVDDLILGYLALITGHVPRVGWVTDLVVGPQFRRQGLATQLVHNARGWLAERGFPVMNLEMQSKNYPAIALAKKMGFQFSGYSDQYYPDQEIALFFTYEYGS
jgi:ribosomal protein S18 acetylase RimI-like enzyme